YRGKFERRPEFRQAVALGRVPKERVAAAALPLDVDVGDLPGRARWNFEVVDRVAVGVERRGSAGRRFRFQEGSPRFVPSGVFERREGGNEPSCGPGRLVVENLRVSERSEQADKNRNG